MCIICVKPKTSARPAADTLREMYKRNPDGAGIAYASGGVVVLKKGLMTIDEFLKAADKVPEDAPAIYHCRISTSGGVCKELTHPYNLAADIKTQRQTRSTWALPAVAHNGVFARFAKKDLNNDTTQFITNYLAPLQKLKTQTGGSIIDDDVAAIINELVGSSKIAILTPDGNLKMYGSYWIEDGGLSYSNATYKPYTPPTYSYASSYYGTPRKRHDKTLYDWYEDDIFDIWDDDLASVNPAHIQSTKKTTDTK